MNVVTCCHSSWLRELYTANDVATKQQNSATKQNLDKQLVNTWIIIYINNVIIKLV